MSKNSPRSIASAGSESAGSIRQRSTARADRSSSNPASYSGDNDTALPSMELHSQPTVTHRRTGSTLKTVMRKIFNRKRQSQADELEETPCESAYSMPRRNTGPVRGRPFLAVPPPLNLTSNRSSPLSAENLQLAETHLSPLSPLSPASMHSPGVPRRRRATLPSVIFSDDESRYAVASTAISEPREEMSHVQDRRHSLLSHRLSRSTEALQALTDRQPEVVTAWPPRKSSARPASVSDTKSPRYESSNSGQSRRPSTGTTVTSVTRASAAPSVTESEHQEPALPSNLATLVHTMQHDDSVTLEQRLTTLEVKMIDLEFAIARMQTNDSDPRHKHPVSDSLPCKPGFISPSNQTSPLPSIRPSSTSTIRPERSLRPAPSATSLSDYQGVSIEQYSTLVTLLRREQTARRNLESQVGSLRDDVRLLQRAAMESIQSGNMQPAHTTDSPEFIRFRRALDDNSHNSPPLRSEEKLDADSEWDRSVYSRDDPIGPKWERQRVVTAPMI
ncbi:unnamed protein product [Penicillium olsonii]|uniref:Uncharacterized protein n=1 Tax=Penicillium olsonii TaxID=99116 RepID=A0A9W4I6F8_PENOL|nr:unnamed protein product [Penicillium olsonii]CAG8162925.1 unnamed protein product [Penicillium olsonii]CAG8246491.1 unnamed protein product [Penicillium olsonii]